MRFGNIIDRSSLKSISRKTSYTRRLLQMYIFFTVINIFLSQLLCYFATGLHNCYMSPYIHHAKICYRFINIYNCMHISLYAAVSVPQAQNCSAIQISLLFLLFPQFSYQITSLWHLPFFSLSCCISSKHFFWRTFLLPPKIYLNTFINIILLLDRVTILIVDPGPWETTA